MHERNVAVHSFLEPEIKLSDPLTFMTGSNVLNVLPNCKRRSFHKNRCCHPLPGYIVAYNLAVPQLN